MTGNRHLPSVAAAYGAQGFGYAAIVTVLPEFKDRLGISDIVVSLLLLGTCLAAALGSVAAEAIAVRWGSGRALTAALGAQAVALVGAATLGNLPLFAVALTLYGIGLGGVDAASNMQGVLVQRKAGRQLLGRFYAGYTAAAIAGALLVAGLLALELPAVIALFAAAAVHSGVALLGFDPEGTVRQRDTGGSLPWPAIRIVGALVFAAFVVDSAVATWSTVYLADGLGAVAAVTPLGYAAYQAAVLGARLTVDAAVARSGRTPVALGAVAAGLAGCALVAALPLVPGAIVGFAAAGLCAGALVPIAFSAAGAVRPERSDEIIATVNLFNYAGALAGAVLPGLISAGPALRAAFLLPAVCLLLVLPLVRRVDRLTGAQGR
ncbi:MFS transporter [Nocardia harenae]|uniref:MFS transporter n=1 Tax=Nocardia harenae TaxID=358707 RepID=UPI0008325C96|nr:MFS transporter [Nocardia harenae]